MNDRHEARLLLAILAERWDVADALRRQRAPDPEVFVALTRASDVHPQVHALLERLDRFHLVGEAARARLQELRGKVQRDNLLLLAQAEAALDLLLESGIVPVALKGLDVLHRFHLRFDERTLDDVDLLVRRGELARAVALLESAGWKAPPEPERTHWLRSSFEIPLVSPGPVKVAFEIHWSLGQERRYRVDAQALIDRAVPLEVAGRRVLRLEDHDAAAHLLLHHVQHYFDRRLKWALDLGRLARQPGFDWSAVGNRITMWGGRAAAGMVLLHLRKLFPELVASAAGGRIRSSVWRRVLTWPLRSAHPLDLFRGTRTRGVQILLAGVLFETPARLPAYLLHRSLRDRKAPSDPQV